MVAGFLPLFHAGHFSAARKIPTCVTCGSKQTRGRLRLTICLENLPYSLDATIHTLKQSVFDIQLTDTSWGAHNLHIGYINGNVYRRLSKIAVTTASAHVSGRHRAVDDRQAAAAAKGLHPCWLLAAGGGRRFGTHMVTDQHFPEETARTGRKCASNPQLLGTAAFPQVRLGDAAVFFGQSLPHLMCRLVATSADRCGQVRTGADPPMVSPSVICVIEKDARGTVVAAGDMHQ